MAAIGFIGVGSMGGAMAARMLEQGGELVIYDSNAATRARFQELGAAVAESPRDVADRAETVFACLPTAQISQNVAYGEDGVIGGTKIRTYIETSTIGGGVIIDIAEKLAPRGINVLDAPVSGAVLGARTGTLTIMVAGPEAGVAALQPILPLFTKRFFYLGEKHGTAQTCKLVNNAIGCVGVLAACEAIAAGVKAGLDAETLLNVINVSSGVNFFTRESFPAFILTHTFAGAGPIEIGAKDLALYVEESDRVGAVSPLSTAAAELWAKIAASGEAGRDSSKTFLYFCELAGIDYPVEAAPDDRRQK
jgi:3-hydroxyisobutyrate dehydrogenase-like beta-hydroxyacid dehydrogenase